uniref:Myotubularin-related protein 2-like n=1 Tax=Dermatophagoides pteronyssinus TaxID=6956 RepID=A0A6P6XJN1_DERPT|nr:myotubularin-related protein 2-like [Dermatophagoides pteronyssinus]
MSYRTKHASLWRSSQPLASFNDRRCIEDEQLYEKHSESGIVIIKNLHDSLLPTILSSQWFKNLSMILNASVKMANLLQNGKNILVHCSDGWDRTAQLASLCCVIMDSRFRTINGLLELIEREFLWFGHKFRTRHGNNTQQKTLVYEPELRFI